MVSLADVHSQFWGTSAGTAKVATDTFQSPGTSKNNMAPRRKKRVVGVAGGGGVGGRKRRRGGGRGVGQERR